jgi:anti-anti-sigma factor
MTVRIFEHTTEEQGPVRIAHLCGEVDSYTFDRFKGVIAPFIEDESPRVVLDCSDLTYLNSRGIGYLSQAHRQVVEKGGKLIVSGLNDRIRYVMDRVGLSGTLSICETLDDAVRQAES